MPYVVGESPRERIEREKQLTVDAAPEARIVTNRSADLLGE